MLVLRVIFVVFVLLLIVVSKVYCDTAVYRPGKFNGMVFSLSNVPPPPKFKLPSLAACKRTVNTWRRGCALSRSQLGPEFEEYARRLEKGISSVIGEGVQVSPVEDGLGICVLVYDEPRDFIDWHYDVNVYEGRFFTCLVPMYVDSESCTAFEFKDRGGKDVRVDGAVLFEGNNVFHRATPQCKGQTRVILSVSFVTSPKTTMYGRFVRYVKSLGF